ncbi:hypothetical protein CDAR_284991 [Caerostris darwini]|uniref:Uncharacterized protein n=1 Tax=Caerostris darwini TaxID=1538125 RepID=A0AAV4ND58_9ARAC|nr:hypothetical protein CDAR_284991 [Caerostris darwini]
MRVIVDYYVVHLQEVQDMAYVLLEREKNDNKLLLRNLNLPVESCKEGNESVYQEADTAAEITTRSFDCSCFLSCCLHVVSPCCNDSSVRSKWRSLFLMGGGGFALCGRERSMSMAEGQPRDLPWCVMKGSDQVGRNFFCEVVIEMSIEVVLSPLHGVHEPAAHWLSRDIRVSSSIRQCLPLLPFRRISFLFWS